MASPREKIDNKSTPCRAVTEVDAKSKIDPKIGPTHGVQPMAKDPPKIKEVMDLPRLLCKAAGIFNLFSEDKNGILNNPINDSPKVITNTPPIRVSHILDEAKAVPNKPDNVPNIMKTTLKPKTKNTPLRKIFLLALFAFLGSWRSSADIPLIKPR